TDGHTLKYVMQTDDLGDSDVIVTGISFAPDGRVFQTVAPADGGGDFYPHDVVYKPDGSGLIVLVGRLDNTAELWELDLDGNKIGSSHAIDLDEGYNGEPMKVDIACDAKTVYYTDQGRTIFTYDLETHTQLDPFVQLPTDSPYVYGGFKLLPDGDLVVAMTGSGDGPLNAVCLDADPTLFWTDEVNPADGTYRVYQRSLADGSAVQAVEAALTPAGLNGQILSLGCWGRPCDEPPNVDQAAVWYRSDSLLTCADCELVPVSLAADLTLDNSTGWVLHSRAGGATPQPLPVCRDAEDHDCSPTDDPYDALINSQGLPDAAAYLELHHAAQSRLFDTLPSIYQPSLTTGPFPPIIAALNNPSVFDATAGWTVFVAVRFDEGAVGGTSSSIFDGQMELLFQAGRDVGLAIGRGTLDTGPEAIAQYGTTVVKLPVLGLVGRIRVFVLRFDPSDSSLMLAERCSGKVSKTVVNPPPMASGLQLLAPATTVGNGGRYAAEKDFFEFIVFPEPLADEHIEGDLAYIAGRYGLEDCPAAPDHEGPLSTPTGRFFYWVRERWEDIATVPGG